MYEKELVFILWWLFITPVYILYYSHRWLYLLKLKEKHIKPEHGNLSVLIGQAKELTGNDQFTVYLTEQEESLFYGTKPLLFLLYRPNILLLSKESIKALTLDKDGHIMLMWLLSSEAEYLSRPNSITLKVLLLFLLPFYPIIILLSPVFRRIRSNTDQHSLVELGINRELAAKCLFIIWTKGSINPKDWKACVYNQKKEHKKDHMLTVLKMFRSDIHINDRAFNILMKNKHESDEYSEYVSKYTNTCRSHSKLESKFCTVCGQYLAKTPDE